MLIANGRLVLGRSIRLLAVLLTLQSVQAADEQRGHGKGGGSRMPIQHSPCNDVPAHPFDIILGRATRDSVTASVLVYQDTEGCLVFGTQHAALTQQTPRRLFKKYEPAEIVLGALQPDTQYFYQFRGGGTNSAEYSFRTQRPRGSAFTFTITADPHLDEHTSATTYQQPLANARADKPDSNCCWEPTQHSTVRFTRVLLKCTPVTRCLTWLLWRGRPAVSLYATWFRVKSSVLAHMLLF